MAFLKFLEGIRTPFFDKIFGQLTHLGDETALLLIALVLIWCIDKRFGWRLLFMALTSGILNSFLKAIFCVPRPWLRDLDFTIVESAREAATGYSFPSGHTQTACVAYGGMAVRVKKRWAYIMASALTLLIAFSRMYLGVHTLLDVGASLCLGILALALFNVLFAKIGGDHKKLLLLYFGGLALALAYLGFVYIMPVQSDAMEAFDAQARKNACVFMGCMLGFLCAWFLEERYVRYETKAVWWAQALKCLLGLMVVGGVQGGLKAPLEALFGDSYFADGLRYFLMVLVGGALWPLSFRYFGRLGRKGVA